jgi:hypothetical protein
MDNKKPEVKRTGTAKIKKKSTAEKLKEVFVPDDVEQVKRHILIDLIVPRLKTISVDIFKAVSLKSGFLKAVYKVFKH